MVIRQMMVSLMDIINMVAMTTTMATISAMIVIMPSLKILLIDSTQRYYKKCLVHKDRLVGAILMGDKSEFAEFKGLIEEKIELSQKRKELLRGKSSKGEMIGEMVCSCGNVGKGNLLQAMEAGCRDLGKLCKQTGAGLGCGSCKPEIQHLLDQHQVAMVDA